MKKYLKKLARLGIFFVILSLGNLTTDDVYAHSGRTDSQGGHHDYGNVSGLGSYHYHHGYPAHLHTNGCPYEGGSGSSSSVSSASTKKKDTIQIKSYKEVMEVGHKQTIFYTISSDYSTTCKLSSSNESVIKVTGNKLIAVSAGTSRITLKSYNNSKQFIVTVKSVEVEEVKSICRESGDSGWTHRGRESVGFT